MILWGGFSIPPKRAKPGPSGSMLTHHRIILYHPSPSAQVTCWPQSFLIPHLIVYVRVPVPPFYQSFFIMFSRVVSSPLGGRPPTKHLVDDGRYFNNTMILPLPCPYEIELAVPYITILVTCILDTYPNFWSLNIPVVVYCRNPATYQHGSTVYQYLFVNMCQSSSHILYIYILY